MKSKTDKTTYDQCHGADIANSHMPKAIKSQVFLREVADVLREWYPQIIDTFKHYATLSVKQDNIYMSYSEMGEFIKDCDLYDNHFTRIEYDIIFKAINYNENESEINP
jgi:hypothetical protein